MRTRVLVVAAVAVLAVLIAWQLRGRSTRTRERELVDAAARIYGDPGVRTTHATAPVPGSFGEAVAPLLARLAVLKDEDIAQPIPEYTAMRAAVSGQAKWASLAPASRGFADEYRKEIDALLLASRRASGALGELQGFSSEDPVAEGLLAIQQAMKWSVIATRDASEAGRHAEAADRCLDGFGVARDVSRGADVFHRMVAAAIVSTLFETCGLAFDRAPRDVQRRSLDAMTRIRANVPPWSATLEGDTVHTELLFFGGLLSPETRKALPVRAERLAFRAKIPTRLEAIQLQRSWVHYRRMRDGLEDIVDLPSRQEREKRLAELTWAGTERFTHEDVPMAASSANMTGLIEKDREARARLDALRVALAADLFRKDRSGWPARPDELVAAGLLDEVPFDGRTESPITMRLGTAGSLVIAGESVSVEGISPASRPLVVRPE